MTTQSRPYQLTVDGFGPDHFYVHALTGTEAMSEAWSFDVVATGPSGDDVERGALGQRATLIFNLAEKPRAFYGIVAAVRVDEVHVANRSLKYVVRVVPRLWLLKRKKRTRIFQNMRVPDIVSSVLLEAGIATRWQLARAYPAREYCTQYEETDYQFVRRILAEAGIFFYFFGGGPVDSAALTADAVVGGVAAAGSAVATFVGGTDAGGLVGAAAQMAETLIPGDTVVGADDASCYPPLAGDDPAALAASTAAAMASAIGDVLGAGGIAGAAIGTASAVAGTVIADVLDAARATPTIHFMANVDAHVSRYDKTTRFTLRNKVRSTAAAFRDYDPDRPLVRLQSKAVSTQPFPPSPFEIAAEAAAAAENVATAAASVLPGPVGDVLDQVDDVISEVDSVVNEVGAAVGQKVPFEVYEHHSPFLFPKWAFASDEAPRILRQKRRRVSIATGESGCCDFSPAHRFELEDHPAPQLDGAYVLTRVQHHGDVHPTDEPGWKVYWNTFECAPAEMPYPPSHPKRKSVQVTLTATVVGPAGEEIWVDDRGQIKVQFHWDREGKYDDKSSCWIRVMQPWAGAGWGHQFIPRVGMEVVVTFEGGDPDKPMVLGSLYNGTHPPPFKLPEDKTRSGIRTQTSRGGGGFNELSFQDRKGIEQIDLRAQRDLRELVLNDHWTDVRHNQSNGVGGDQTNAVAGNQTENVGKNQGISVGGNRNQSIEGNSSGHVGGNHSESVAGHRRIEVSGSDHLKVVGPRSESVEKDYVLQIEGRHSVVVGLGAKETKADYYVRGDYFVTSAGRLKIQADHAIVLQCGESAIEITPGGIKIHGGALSMAGKDSVSLAAKGPSLDLGDKAELSAKHLVIRTESASLEMFKDASLKGNRVMLNCDEAEVDHETSDSPPDETRSFKLSAKDPDLQPYAGKHYALTVDGTKYEGDTGGDGSIEQQIPKDAKTADLTVWIDEYPEGKKLYWHFDIGDLAPVDTLKGAQMRLKNLGYLTTPVSDTLDDAVIAALRWFQRDHHIEETGELDDPTKKALGDAHGH